MLRNVPMVLEGYKLRVVEDPVIKTYTKDGKTEYALNDNDQPMYVVALYFKAKPREDGRPAGKGTEMKVTLETQPSEEITDGALVELHNPRFSQFPMDNGGAGLTIRASGIKLAG
ncbi:hypothetical protein SAMN05421805_10382 [Saccharopolyspora antimicrobica]|uniref:Uncharacterized protein n=1 Tax=Saccharopolyspora antimicrobica TaxID=455193 RepID=A0A1I4WUF3_9PSEU|nr:hypothetical protein [Saccharopolyspora antimicrobica]RKT82945.1 hypothetical protein ATL45_1208 [Saccharopolyspora antimicrobica]SFN17438.1 hypothetical protein SAMN05421805_10382 [Saccharopolyspora antimicrobica]